MEKVFMTPIESLISSLNLQRLRRRLEKDAVDNGVVPERDLGDRRRYRDSESRAGTFALAGMCAGLGSTVGNRPAIAAETLKTLRMGYQKYGTLVLLKATRRLEKRFEPLGISITWTAFPGGPKLMEAINLGSIDFGTTGDAPPIIAQGAGTPFVYVGYEPPVPKGEAVVVLDGSPIRSVGDLKAKRLAVNRGSNAHYLSLRALVKAGPGVGDVEFVFLPPADGRPAFERGRVDAWAIWDPVLAAIEIDIPVRVIADGASVGVNNYQFYHATRELREQHTEVAAATLEEIATLDESAKEDVPRIAAVLAPSIGMKTEAVERARAHGLRRAAARSGRSERTAAACRQFLRR